MEALHKCQDCGKAFSKRQALRRHKNRKIPCNAIHKCPRCSKVFKNPFELKRHQNRKTPRQLALTDVSTPPEETHLCKYCGRTYSSIYTLSRHVKTSCKIKTVGIEFLYTQTLKENEELKKKLREMEGEKLI